VELGKTWPWKGLLGMVQDIQSPLIVLSSHQILIVVGIAGLKILAKE